MITSNIPKDLTPIDIAKRVHRKLFGETIQFKKPSIKQAFRVLEVLRQTYCCITINSDWTYCWRIEMTKGEQKIGDPHEVTVIVDGEESLPEAIYRAAYKALFF